MKKFTLECCVDSIESAINGEKGGATRLELCSNLIIGGTTPDISFFNYVKKVINIPINVLIRPRFGDFLYSDYEVAIMSEQIEALSKMGANGVVIGCLNEDGDLDNKKMEKLISKAENMEVTLHRAFDMARDPLKTLDTATRLGVTTILTSGQQNSALQGAELIKILVENSKINILVGAGVKSSNIETLYKKTKAKNYHLSGKIIEESKMRYRNPNVFMGLPNFSEYENWVTSTEEIKEARTVLASILA